MTLFDDPPAQRHSATSRAAADSLGPMAGTLRRRVYDAIATYGPITDEHIATVTGLSPNTARPRRVELVARGLVQAHYQTQPTESGRRATAWVICDPPWDPNAELP